MLGLGALLVPSANAPAFTLLTLAPEGVRAKVTTAVLTLNTAVMPLGYLVGGLVISRLGVRTAFVIVAALALLTAAVFWRVSTRAESVDPSLGSIPRELISTGRAGSRSIQRGRERKEA